MKQAPAWPARGVAGGWRGPWDSADDLADIHRRIAAADAERERVAIAWRPDRH